MSDEDGISEEDFALALGVYGAIAGLLLCLVIGLYVWIGVLTKRLNRVAMQSANVPTTVPETEEPVYQDVNSPVYQNADSFGSLPNGKQEKRYLNPVDSSNQTNLDDNNVF